MTTRSLLLFLLLTLVAACDNGQDLKIKNGFAVLPVVERNEKLATFAGGCFWAMQECMIELKGVNRVISGYAGGNKQNPTYDEVLQKKTGHAESVLVYYNPKLVSYQQLLDAFFEAHDPTQVDRQGPDVGSSYRSIAFYRSEEEEEIIRNSVKDFNDTGQFKHPAATEIVEFEVFYPAEAEHQDYYPKNTLDPYIRKVSKPKVMKMRKSLPDLIKPEYQE